MLADGRTYISTSWWLALFPGLCIFFNVLGINLLGGGLRDPLGPRLKAIGIGHRVMDSAARQALLAMQSAA